MSNSTDLDIVAHARREARTCVTLDADFHTLLATSGEMSPSVIRLRRQGLDAAALADLLQRIWPAIESALTHGAMVTVTDRTIRSRRLPIVRA
jgi:predicted nuclease of predicted toxin-antitoxin system